MSLLVEVALLVSIGAVAYLVGRLLLAVLLPGADGLARTGSLLLGLGAMALQLWVYGFAHLPWNGVALLLPWIVAGAVYRRRLGRALRDDARDLVAFGRGLRALDPLTGTLLAFAAFAMLLYVASSLAQPLQAWDALAMWLFKARVFMDAQAVTLAAPALAGQATLRHFDYPPLSPLMTDVMWVLRGQVDDSLGKAVNLYFLVTVVAAAWSLLAKTLGQRLAVLAVFLLATSPLLWPVFFRASQTAYADYPVAAAMALSLAHLYAARGVGRDGHAVLALVFAAMAASIKNEGITFFLAIAGITLVGFAVNRGRSQARLAPAAVAGVVAAFAPVLCWELYVRSHGFASDVLAPARHPAQLLREAPANVVTLARLVRHLPQRDNDYPWLAAALVLAAVLVFVRRSGRLLVLLALILLQATTYVLALVTSIHGVTYEFETAGDRLILQLMPMVVLVLALALAARPPAGSPA